MSTEEKSVIFTLLSVDAGGCFLGYYQHKFKDKKKLVHKFVSLDS